MEHTACPVCFISTVNGCIKKKEKEKVNALEDVALVAGTQQNLSSLYSLDIYAQRPWIDVLFVNPTAWWAMKYGKQTDLTI
jgi:hypothetical protein